MFRKSLKLVGFLLLGLAGLVVLLEVSLRILGAHRPVLYGKDPVLGFRLKPNQHVTFFGNEIQINQYGVRDPRSLDTTPPDTTRILVLGDSVTWGGIRIPQHELFTSVLEGQLGDAEIINAGVNGYSVWRMATFYREHLQELEPNIILLYVIPGDFHRAAVVDLIRTSPAFPLESTTFALSSSLASARIVMSARMGWDWLRSPSPGAPREDRSEEDRIRLNLDAIVALAQELETDQRLIVVVSPFPDHPANPQLPPIVRDTLSDAGIELLELNDSSMRTGENFVDHIHLSARGHAAVAQALVEHLRQSVTKQE